MTDDVTQPGEGDPRIATLQNMLGNSLLTPTNPNVNYAFELIRADAYTTELCAEKFWFTENGQLEYSSQPLKAYELYDMDTEADRAAVREESQMDRENLLRVNETQGLGVAMRAAEQMAVQHHYLDPNREDDRLFPQGPEDPFVTGREALAILSKVAELGPELALADKPQVVPEYGIGLGTDDEGKTNLDLVKTWKGGVEDGAGEAHRLIGVYEDSVEAVLLTQELLDVRRDAAAVAGSSIAGDRAMVSLGCEIAIANGLMKEGDMPFGKDGPTDPFEVQPTSILFAELEAQRAGAVQSVGVESLSAPQFDLDI